MPILSSLNKYNYTEIPKRKVGFIDDFFLHPSQYLQATYLVVSSNFSNYVNKFDNQENNRFGVIELSTSTASTAFSALSSRVYNNTSRSLRLGQGITITEILIKIPTLSTSGERYRIMFGFVSAYAEAESNRITIEYDEANSANWRYATEKDDTVTINDSSVVVNSNQWYKLKIIVNHNASSVEYFIDDTSIGTITTNIPNESGEEVIIYFAIRKSVGSTARTVLVDYFLLDMDLTTYR